MAHEAGKGSKSRRTEVSRETLATNWDRIFGKKNTTVNAEIERYSQPEPKREYEMNWVAENEQKNG